MTLRFGGVRALDDVSFTVAPGTLHALIGPNGAGKSTCFNVISGLYRPTRAGAARRRGPHRPAPHQLAGLGLGRSFQNLALSAHSTVLDNVMLGRHAHPRRVPRLRALRRGPTAGTAPPRPRRGDLRVPRHRRALSTAGRRTALRRRRRRVDIARALAIEPAVLLLDEPAAGMNAAETAELAGTIREVRDASWASRSCWSSTTWTW